MSDTPNTDRERFEQFHGQRRSKGAGWRERMFVRLPDGTYADESVQRHWWTWQNALKAQAAEIARAKQMLKQWRRDYDAKVTELARLRAQPVPSFDWNSANGDRCLEALFDAVHEHGEFGRGFREDARRIIAEMVSAPPSADAVCPCGYPMPCIKKVPATLCRQPIDAAAGKERCKHCGGEMKEGTALAQTYDCSDEGTMSPGGPGVLVPCSKCATCGWSVSINKESTP